MKKFLQILFGFVLVFGLTVNFSFSEESDEENETIANCPGLDFISLFNAEGKTIIKYCLDDVIKAVPTSQSEVTIENGNIEIEDFENEDEYPKITSQLERLLLGIKELNEQDFDFLENDEAFIEIMIHVNEPTSVSPLPDYVQIRYEIENMVQALVPINKIYELESDPNVSRLDTVERPQEFGRSNDDTSKSTNILPPKQQLKEGTLLENIICKENFELIFKSIDNSPACVKPQTIEKLIERGWGTLALNKN